MILIIGQVDGKIDKFIQDSQLNANGHWEVIEWIPYDRFKDVEQIGRGGFGTIHFARWIDGFIEKWDIKNHQWERYGKEKAMALKMFDNLYSSPRLLSLKYLSSNFKYSCFIKISDFGLSKIIKENPNNPEKKNIVGVLPYIAPEVLSGEKEYTKAADVYSFGIIAYEIVIGFPPYPDIPHDKDLAMKIYARVTSNELYYDDYYDYLDKEKNKDSEIGIQIKKAEEFLANQESINTTTTTTTTPIHKQFILVDFLIIQIFPNPRMKKILKKKRRINKIYFCFKYW
ncbi:hypothetical protein Glove_83g114 [Diversispora epigaea]|uniref:mitogen-activated protein kinase kinase n=1 Tax=Diversispora epigaea TaxID=1348612 RepID=A0A397JIB8_9GLOM|nr:hypothetical protein Glove_83g114 [Diversispora epigaea]